jgi:hypothetical protein
VKLYSKGGSVRTTLALAVAAAVFAVLAAGTQATPAATIKICGQIANGPAHDWSFPAAVARQLGIPARVKGTRWTVLADGVACSFALKRTPALLKQWKSAKPGKRLVPGVAGWICAKDKGYVGQGGKGSPGGSCLKSGALFSFIGSGSYTLAQVKQLAATGKLPTG